MLITDIHKMKMGTAFRYRGQLATILHNRAPAASDFIPDDKGKMVEYPDRSVGVSFSYPLGIVHLESRLDARMAVGGKMLPLDLSDYAER